MKQKEKQTLIERMERTLGALILRHENSLQTDNAYYISGRAALHKRDISAVERQLKELKAHA